MLPNDKLVDFLYVLIRDYVTPGIVEEIMVNHVEKNPERERSYSNPHLADYAAELADRHQ
jgi:hypothetical protein